MSTPSFSGVGAIFTTFVLDLHNVLVTYFACKLLTNTGHGRLDPASVQVVNPFPGDKFIKYMLIVHLF